MTEAAPRSAADRGFRKAVRAAVCARPALLEPGLILQGHPLRLAGDRKLRVHGVDVLGHPCVVECFRRLDAEAWDWMLAVLCAFREGQAGADPVYARGRQPRLFVLAPQFRPEDLARARVLDEAAPVRAFRVRAAGSSDWEADMVLPAPEPAGADWIAAAPVAGRSALLRIAATCARGARRAEIVHGRWPVLVRTAAGAVASIHRDGERLWFLAAGPDGGLLDLSREDDADRAVDRLLRALRGPSVVRA